MKILLINGPPRSGKDTAARALLALPDLRVEIDRFSQPIKSAFAGMMAPLGATLDSVGNVQPFEQTKEHLIHVLGTSFRNWQINFAEHFMKPLYGPTVFSRLFIVRAFNSTADLIVVPDCGFQLEYEAVCNAYPREDIALMRLYREHCTFSGDSREYVEPNGTTFLPIANHSTEFKFQADVVRAALHFLHPHSEPHSELAK